MYIEREIWKGGKVVGEKSLKIILNRSISTWQGSTPSDLHCGVLAS